MSGLRKGVKRRWLVSAGGSLLVGGLVVALFKVHPEPVVTPVAPAVPPIRLSPGRADELAMRDLKPLFLPTPFNASPTSLPRLDPGRRLFDVDAQKWKFADEGPSLQLPAAAVPPPRPVDTLDDDSGPLASGMGRTDRKIEPLPASGGHIEVFSGDRADSVLEMELPVDARPTGSVREASTWQPLEFVAVINVMGQVGSLVLVQKSGVEEVDVHFRNYLAERFRLGDRLAPGIYRVVVGP